MKKILLITHDTSLSGAPKSLLLVFEALKKKGYLVTTVSLKGGGKLEERFKQLSINYYNLDQYSKTVTFSLKNRLKKKIFGTSFFSAYDLIYQQITSTNYDIIYCNTVVSLKIALEYNKLIHGKLVLHVHELKTVIEEYCPTLSSLENKIDSFIVPSKLNESCLINDYQVPKEKIFIVRETTDFIFHDFVKKLNGPIINVLMCGGAYWRKGDDLFLQIAHLILKQNLNFRFYWVGFQSEERKRVNQSDVEKLGIKDFIFFIDETEQPMQWYQQADLFLLSSREDPFPLAAMEAGLMGLPIFCFDKATGIAEVINPYCVVPYLEIEEMAQRILNFIEDDKLRDQISIENINTFIKFTSNYISEIIDSIISN